MLKKAKLNKTWLFPKLNYQATGTWDLGTRDWDWTGNSEMGMGNWNGKWEWK